MTAIAATQRESWDPLSYRLPSPRSATYYPMGCAVEITTNSDDVLRAAESVWSENRERLFEGTTRLTVSVSNEDADLGANPPVGRGQENLVSFVDGPANFAVTDLDRAFAHVVVSRNAAANSSFLLDTFLEPLTYLMLGARYFSLIHASCVALGEKAVVLCGDSGAGKTCLAYMCARTGWTFLSGDAVQVTRGSMDYEVVGRPYSIRFRGTARRLFPELVGFPTSARRFGSKIDMECSTRSLEIDTALRANASHVVFLNRVIDMEGARLEEFDRRDAFMWMDRAVCYGGEDLRNEQRAALSNILNLPVLRLTFSDIGEAERTLRRLVDRP